MYKRILFKFYVCICIKNLSLGIVNGQISIIYHRVMALVNGQKMFFGLKFLYYLEYKAILKILSVCCAPTDPPKSPRPKFFFRYFRFFNFFSGFPRTPIVRRKRTSKASSDFHYNQCTPRFKRHVVNSNQFQND